MRRSGGSRGSSPSSGLSYCHWLLLLLWILVAIWFLFLFQFHLFSAPDNRPPSAGAEAKAALRKGGIPKKTIVSNEIQETVLKINENYSVPKAKDASFHVVFSTDCSFYQSWQTLMLFYSATQVKQQGTVTRIASGCDDAAKKELTELYDKLYPGGRFNVHFTPDF